MNITVPTEVLRQILSAEDLARIVLVSDIVQGVESVRRRQEELSNEFKARCKQLDNEKAELWAACKHWAVKKVDSWEKGHSCEECLVCGRRL